MNKAIGNGMLAAGFVVIVGARLFTARLTEMEALAAVPLVWIVGVVLVIAGYVIATKGQAA